VGHVGTNRTDPRDEPAVVDDPDNTPLGFGKYCNATPAQLLTRDPTYLAWALRNTGRVVVSPDLRSVLRRIVRMP
jgi:hypothetical protein